MFQEVYLSRSDLGWEEVPKDRSHPWIRRRTFYTQYGWVILKSDWIWCFIFAGIGAGRH